MDAISGLFSSADSPISKLLPIILAGSGIFGTVGNIQGNSARNAVLQQQMDLTRKYANLTPAQLTKMISSLEVPLSKNLTNSVGNTVQGQLAERGLSQAPGIFATSLGQGLAPYEIQEQGLAQDALFKQLGLPIQSRPSPFGPFPQQTNTTAIWSQLLKQFMNPSSLAASPLPSGTSIPQLDQLMFGGPQMSGTNFSLPLNFDPNVINDMLSGGGLTPPPIVPPSSGNEVSL